MLQQIVEILVDTISTRALEFIWSIATGQNSHRQCSGSSGCKQIPNAVADDNRRADVDA